MNGRVGRDPVTDGRSGASALDARRSRAYLSGGGEPGAGTVLTALGEGLWLDDEPVSILGMRLRSTMTVLRLGDGGLVLVSPVRMTPERRAAVGALGGVAHLYAPNLYHHLWIGEWAAAFPAARVHAPEGLSRKQPGLRIDRVHGSVPEPAFAGLLDEHRIDGFRLGESVLLYRPARTLIVTDLVQNLGRPEQPWARLYTRAMGCYDRLALSRLIRWTSFSDRAAARRSLDAVLALDFERIVVGHGQPIESGAKAALTAAFSWL